MLRKSATTKVPDEPLKKEEPMEVEELSLEQKMDVVIKLLQRAEKRDRIRTVGGAIRGFLGMIPLLIMLGSLWYVYLYGDQLLQKITAEAAKQAATYSQDSMGSFWDNIEQYIPKGTPKP